jgi:hypothetical protein
MPITVSKADTSSAISVLTPASGIVAAGSPLTLRVLVSPAAYVQASAARPTGTVTFTVAGVAQTPVSVLPDGSATFTVNTSAAGTFSATASYSGDANYNASSTIASASYSVASIALAPFTVNSQPRISIQRGELLTLAATLSTSVTTPLGSVQFGIPGSGSSFTVIATATPGSAGSYSASIDSGNPAFNLPVGSFNIAARYIPASGDPMPLLSSNLANLAVSKQATILTGALGSFTISYGQQVPLQNASIAPSLGANSSIPFASGQSVGLLAGGNQNASIPFSDTDRNLPLPQTASLLAPGTYSIQLRYAGDANYAASSLDLAPLTVQKASTSVALTPATGSVLRSGTAITLAASVTTASAGLAPSGLVQFTLNGVALGAPVAVSAGKASLAYTPSRSGTGVFAAQYLGDSNYNGSTTSASLRTAAIQPFFAIASRAGSYFMTYDSKTGRQLSVYRPLGASYTGGFRVATGDVNGDGVADLLWTSNTGSFVRVIDGLTRNNLGGFYAFGSSFARPVNIAVADYNGDGYGDIIAAPGSSGVAASFRVFSGKNYALLLNKSVLGGATGGVSVTGADVNGDGRDEVIVSPMSGAGPRIQVYNGGTGALISDFNAFATTARTGYNIAATDLTGDGKAELVVSPMSGAQQAVVVGNGRLAGTDSSNAPAALFFPFSAGFTGGASVATVDDIDGDGIRDIIAASGPGGQSQVRRFSGRNLAAIDSFFAFASNLPERNKGLFAG